MGKRRHFFNEEYFETLTDEAAYWLGYLYADGYVAIKAPWIVVLQSIDKEHILKFAATIGYDGTPSKTKGGFKNSKVQYRLTLCSKKLCVKLNKMGLRPNDKTAPRLEPLLIKAFLRGLFDGDGSVSTGTRTYNLKGKVYGPYPRTVCNLIVHQSDVALIKFWLAGYGIKTSVSNSKTEYMKYLQWSSKRSIAAWKAIHATEPHLVRKAKILTSPGIE